MFRSRIVRVLTAVGCLLALSVPAFAAEVDCDSVYCFSDADFQGGSDLVGICITDLPDPAAGTVLLGSRVLRPGDILTAGQLSQMTFAPLQSQEDQTASVAYLPVYEHRVAQEAVMTIAIHGKEDKAPAAEDSLLETYKNLANEGKLKAADPENQPLVYTVIRQPKRGTVEVREDGSFTYTPKKNKVGTDSFTYTAADPAGNVSREATVTVQILKPTDDTRYTDTAGAGCSFTAEWMRNTGIFAGETVGQDLCFGPEKAVTRGEFLAMTMEALELPADFAAAATGFEDECPQWLTPYLAAAARSGLVGGYPTQTGAEFRDAQPITGAEAAAILSRALQLPTPTLTEETDLPAWAAGALASVAEQGIALTDTESVTRSTAANCLYAAARLHAES